MKKHILKLFAVLLCLVCTLSASGIAAYAIDPIALDKDVSLTVTFESGGVCVPNGEFSLYRVADTDEWAHFTASGDFSGYMGTINGFETAEDWDAAAEALVRFAADNKIMPLQKKSTADDGTVTFSDGLKPGLYLVTCAETVFKGYTYTALPALVCLPGRDDSSDALQYDVQVIAKAGGVLNPTPPPPEPPEDLPQTGMLWWPVPVLLVCGLLSVVIGVTRRRSSENEA